jgi:hypothetical protein
VIQTHKKTSMRLLLHWPGLDLCRRSSRVHCSKASRRAIVIVSIIYQFINIRVVFNNTERRLLNYHFPTTTAESN